MTNKLISHKKGKGAHLREFILGGQDGLVNVLGLLLGAATATQFIDQKIVIIAGLSALFAESISMGAVAYTSSKAARDYYYGELQRERREIRVNPDTEQQQLRRLYYKKGFRGTLLDNIVSHISSNKKLWLETIMTEDLRLYPHEYSNPLRTGIIVLIATVIGSLIPLFPYFFWSVGTATIIALAVSAATLFIAGVIKAKWTVGGWKRSGTEMLAIGMLASIAGFGVGILLERIFA
ncbi:hypothetical protein GF342_02380 [Candidatus Woesearchaeota archaeon]|nr:hypothetical protein [Candidatus Woesearchaeota archaeon]